MVGGAGEGAGAGVGVGGAGGGGVEVFHVVAGAEHRALGLPEGERTLVAVPAPPAADQPPAGRCSQISLRRMNHGVKGAS